MTTPDVDSPTTDDRPAVAAYLARLRAELADLPAADVAEIMDDVGPHVIEVADELSAGDAGPADLDQRLAERLGSPERYAAELRAAADYPPKRPAADQQTQVWPARFVLWSLLAALLVVVIGGIWAVDTITYGDGQALALALLALAMAGTSFLVLRGLPGGVADVAALPEVVAARSAVTRHTAVHEYARLLQPAWWLARGLIAGALVTGLLFAGTGAPLVVLAGLPLAVVSIWLGRRSQADRRWLWLALPGNAMAAGLLIGMVLIGGYETALYRPTEYVNGPTEPAFRNIHVFDSEGNYVPGAYLYDERGRPLVPAEQSECGDDGDPYYTDYPPYSGYPDTAEPRYDNRNQYPRPERRYDHDGRCTDVTPEPPVAPIPPDARETTPETSPTSPTSPTVTVTPTK